MHNLVNKKSYERFTYQTPQSRNAQRAAEERTNVSCCNVTASLSRAVVTSLRLLNILEELLVSVLLRALPAECLASKGKGQKVWNYSEKHLLEGSLAPQNWQIIPSCLLLLCLSPWAPMLLWIWKAPAEQDIFDILNKVLTLAEEQKWRRRVSVKVLTDTAWPVLFYPVSREGSSGSWLGFSYSL